MANAKTKAPTPFRSTANLNVEGDQHHQNTEAFGPPRVPHSQYAQFASADTNTTSPGVPPTLSGMADPWDARETKTDTWSTCRSNASASTSNAPEAVHPLPTSTIARVADPEIMELMLAISRRKLKALTPLKAAAWRAALHDTGLFHKYHSIPKGIELGFLIGIPEITQTFAPPNSNSLYQNVDKFLEIVELEQNLGRYIGPLPRNVVEQLIGPFHTSPLSLIPKPHKPNSFRLIQNFSFPHVTSTHRSINSFIESDEFSCTWGTFNTISLIVGHLPQGSQAAVRDVAEAYRILPIHASQWPGTVVRISESDKFAIDTCAAFGVASNAGAYGHLADAGADIMRALGLGSISKWVNDHVFFRVPTTQAGSYNKFRNSCRERILQEKGAHYKGGRIWYRGTLLPDDQIEEFDEDMSFPIRVQNPQINVPTIDQGFTYGIRDIDDISKTLGIPWQKEKDRPFCSTFVFTGFLWNINEKTVTLTEAKHLKYLRAIQDWRKSRTHTLHEAQKLHGKLLHAAQVLPKGRAYITGLETMLTTGMSNPFMPHTPPKGTPFELDWWATKLSLPLIPRQIQPPRTPVDLHAFSDASSSFGIGVVVGNKWRAWKLRPGWDSDRKDIGWAEAVGLEFLVTILTYIQPPGQTFRIYGDNTGVVEGWKRGRSRNHNTNQVFRRIHRLLEKSNSEIRTSYVRSGDNPADGPSRGLYPFSHPLLPEVQILDPLASFIENIQHSFPSSNSRSSPRTPHTPTRCAAPDISRNQILAQKLLEESWSEREKLRHNELE